MADARTQILPLVGGGCHDWATIFGRWGLMNQDTQIAAAVRMTGWIGMGAACLWMVWRWWADRDRVIVLVMGTKPKRDEITPMI